MIRPHYLLLIVLLLVGIAEAPVSAQDDGLFPGLTSGQRVYDETGSSLTTDQVSELNAQLEQLMANGTDAIVFVRSLDATPEETLAQVEALQQAWVAITGGNEDTAVAILINRNPDDANDGRAGIYVGSTYHDGNVPEDEQRAIVDNELIPPLRNGDVFGSLAGGLERLDSSIRNGPPKNAFERWSADAGSGWLPWAGLALAHSDAVKRRPDPKCSRVRIDRAISSQRLRRLWRLAVHKSARFRQRCSFWQSGAP